ncbi:MAG: flavodoxin domain-containing protein [Spirochaetales bacterium]|nr:flavodoxin domain-containing protein [Spirochaetales bacterium]
MSEEKRILNLYATRYGSARFVAEDLGKHLEEQGFLVDTVDIRKEGPLRDLSPYKGIIAGSSVAMFMWVGKVKRFLRRSDVKQLPTLVYVCCGMSIEDREKAREKFLKKQINRLGIEPLYSDALEPVIDFRPEGGLPEKQKQRIAGTIKAMAGDRYEESGLMDFRDQEHFATFLERCTGILKDY